jgi:RecA-family ATPase
VGFPFHTKYAIVSCILHIRVSGDAHSANDVRRYLQPIVELAGELNCAVIGIRHKAKNSVGRDAVSGLIGWQAFTALARMVRQTVRVKDTDDRIVTISVGIYEFTVDHRVNVPIHQPGYTRR